MLEGRHYQNAYVTRNLDKAVAEFTTRADARSVATFEATTEVLTGEGRKSQTLKMAFIWVGDLQYEFIELAPRRSRSSAPGCRTATGRGSTTAAPGSTTGLTSAAASTSSPARSCSRERAAKN